MLGSRYSLNHMKNQMHSQEEAHSFSLFYLPHTQDHDNWFISEFRSRVPLPNPCIGPILPVWCIPGPRKVSLAGTGAVPASLSWEWAGSTCQEIAKQVLPALTCSQLLERTEITGLIWKETQAGAWLLQTLLGHLWAWVQAPAAGLGSAGRCSGNLHVPDCHGRPCTAQHLCRKAAAGLFRLSKSFFWSQLLVPSGQSAVIIAITEIMTLCSSHLKLHILKKGGKMYIDEKWPPGSVL